MSKAVAISHSFAGKKVLVTGGGSGVGLELVTRLYNDGAQVFTIEKNAALVKKLQSDFPKLRAEVADVSKWDETQKLIESFGPLDHLVNNAGIFSIQELLSITEDKFDQVMNVNLKGAFCVTQAVAKGMISGKVQGTIVNVASIGASIVTPGVAVYCTTKAGILMLTKATARELGKYGIRCNAVSPTVIDTPMYHTHRSHKDTAEKTNNSMTSRQPLAGKQTLTAAEVVDTICYLLSPLSSMASGTEVLLDGGVRTC